MTKESLHRLVLQFDDNKLVPALFGEHGSHLNQIEEALNVEIGSRGNEVLLIGPKKTIKTAQRILDMLWKRLNDGLDVATAEVEAAIHISMELDPANRDLALAAFKEAPAHNKGKNKGKSKTVTARSQQQAKYLEAIKNSDVIFGIGPAGTGKTYLAVSQAVAMLVAGEVDRIILCRPAVEAGENLGFLPGDLKEKVDPYLRPIYDALHDMLPVEQVVKKIAEGVIEVAPLAFMRGRTLSNAFIILDEAQNTTVTQIKMALTRIGEGSKMVITGDPSQVDLPYSVKSGLKDAIEVLDGVKGAEMIYFAQADVVRSKIVGRIVDAYDTSDKRKLSDKK